MSDETATAGGRGEQRDGRLGWLDGSLASVVLGSVAVVVLAGLVQVSFGTYSMSLATAWNSVFDPDIFLNLDAWHAFLTGGEAPEMDNETLIVWTIRLPRVFVAMFVGMNLAVSGAIFQAVTRNELASPYVLGVSSGAGLAILLGLIVFTGLTSYLPLLAALGGTAAFLLVYAIAWQGGTNPVRLILAGVIVSTVFNSLQTGVFYFADDLGAVQSAIAWTTGSLTGVDWEQVRTVAPWTAIFLPFALLTSRQLNVLLLGERTAQSLGMSVERVRFGVSAVAIILAAASVAVAGLVGFVGLVVPHMVRTVVGSDYRRVMTGCVFAGPALVVLADVGARLALATQIPVGIVTGIIGGPYFLYLMRKQGTVGEL
ncbi:FecCD family ABC transporter permease [Halorussus halophilus]|uniref:FecCD family ABC transporter permease n=1 Tax=Halorussus halophilus TaxID=2650975 RepID=UPI00130167C9|nr:iron ABC transporter permease [Halorussus halophilus]